MSGEWRGRRDWRIQRGSGAVLVGTAVFLAVTRPEVSETLVGTLLGVGVLLLGVDHPKAWPWRKDDDEEAKPK